MAFVFRSEKQSLFDSKKEDPIPFQQSSMNNDQSQLNGTSYNSSSSANISQSPIKVVKGLPSLLRKQRSSEQYQTQNVFQKQNNVFQQSAIKINKQKLKKMTENYFFSSNVVRDPYNLSSKGISNKNLTCSQFGPVKCQEKQNFELGKLIPSGYTTLNRIVNRSLLSQQVPTETQMSKRMDQVQQKAHELNRILVNCSERDSSEIRRKGSPRVSQKTSSSLLPKKHLPSNLNDSSIVKSTVNQSQICMKTNLEEKGSQPSQMRRSRTSKKLMKLHKGTLQTSFYKCDTQEDQSDQQYDENNDTPGPGAYDNVMHLKEKKSFRSRKEKFAKIFITPLQRFKTQQVKYHEITYVNQGSPEDKHHRNQLFLSRTPKFLPLQKPITSPPPGTYNPRSSMQHEIVRNLLRNANVPNFLSSQKRFHYYETLQKQNFTPGPGQYQLDLLQKAKLQEIKNQLSYAYKSQVKRCLNDHDQKIKDFSKHQNLQVELINDQVSPIHKKEQHFDSSEFFSAPPFLSGVERFNQVQKSPNDSIFNIQAINKQRLTKQPPNSQPFNSSQKRKLTQKVGEGVGVGSYLIQKDKWNKKSYNVFFH